MAEPRTARVIVPALAEAIDLRGPAAELVARVAVTPLSTRTLNLLLCLVTHTAALDAMLIGRLEVDFARGGALHPYLRQSLPRVDMEEVS